MGLFLISAVPIYLAWLVLPATSGTKRRSLERVVLGTGRSGRSDPTATPCSKDWLRRWLFLAGPPAELPPPVRRRDAPGAGRGAAAAVVVLNSGLTKRFVQRPLPASRRRWAICSCRLSTWRLGGSVDPGAPPWCSCAVRGGNGWKRVEQDLPICLELLATLSEAGLGFDAALARVLESVMEDRPLAREFRSYQSDLLAGRTRVESLCGVGPPLGSRPVTILVSALVQAEQLGSGITQALRRPGRRSSRPPPRAGQRLRPGAAGEADVSAGDLLHAGHLRLDAVGPALTQLFQLADTSCGWEILGGERGQDTHLLCEAPGGPPKRCLSPGVS